MATMVMDEYPAERAWAAPPSLQRGDVISTVGIAVPAVGEEFVRCESDELSVAMPSRSIDNRAEVEQYTLASFAVPAIRLSLRWDEYERSACLTSINMLIEFT